MTKEQYQTSFLVLSLSSSLVQMTLVLNCCPDVSIGIVVFSPTSWWCPEGESRVSV